MKNNNRIDKIKELLIEIGLSHNEARLYLAALQLGPSTALQLSKSCDIKRTTVYSVVESLSNKGILHSETRGMKRLFAPENPEKLEAVLENRQRILKDALPELSSMFFGLTETEAFIKHYEGLDGIKSVYDGLLKELKPKDFYLVISDQQKWMSHDPAYFERFKRERATKGLKIRLLLKDSASARKNKPVEAQYDEQIKIFSPEYELSTNMVIVPHKVIMVQTVEPLMALVIENQSIVQMNKTMFEMIWASIPA